MHNQCRTGTLGDTGCGAALVNGLVSSAVDGGAGCRAAIVNVLPPSAVDGGADSGAATVNILSTVSDGFPVYGYPTDVLSKRQGERVVQGGGNENRESRMLVSGSSEPY